LTGLGTGLVGPLAAWAGLCRAIDWMSQVFFVPDGEYLSRLSLLVLMAWLFPAC